MGGIKNGMIVTDTMSLKLDRQVRAQCKIAYGILCTKYSKLKRHAKLSKEMIPGGIGHCAPDGGIWTYDNILIAAFEAKKQNNAGNAIERWYKNESLCRTINTEISYVTFCTGEGAKTKGVMQVALNFKHLHGYNVYKPRGCTTFMSESGFTDEFILKTILSILEERCMSIDNEH